MDYGYVRVSTPKQNNERQKRNILNAYPNAIIYEDIHTRTNFSARENWEELMKVILPGDRIIFDSVSRMCGNADEGVIIYEELFDKNIELVFLAEPHINTSIYKEALNKQIELTGTVVDVILEGINKFFRELAKQQIRIAFDQAEKEVIDIRQRTKDGLQTARIAGRFGGRPGVDRATQKKMYLMYYSGEFSLRKILDDCKISKSTLYNYLAYWSDNPEETPVRYEDIYGKNGINDDDTLAAGRPGVPIKTIEEIQEVYENTDWTYKNLADYYNLSISTIKKYCVGIKKTYKKKKKV